MHRMDHGYFEHKKLKKTLNILNWPMPGGNVHQFLNMWSKSFECKPGEYRTVQAKPFEVGMEIIQVKR